MVVLSSVYYHIVRFQNDFLAEIFPPLGVDDDYPRTGHLGSPVDQDAGNAAGHHDEYWEGY